MKSFISSIFQSYWETRSVKAILTSLWFTRYNCDIKASLPNIYSEVLLYFDCRTLPRRRNIKRVVFLFIRWDFDEKLRDVYRSEKKKEKNIAHMKKYPCLVSHLSHIPKNHLVTMPMPTCTWNVNIERPENQIKNTATVYLRILLCEIHFAIRSKQRFHKMWKLIAHNTVKSWSYPWRVF